MPIETYLSLALVLGGELGGGDVDLLRCLVEVGHFLVLVLLHLI